MPVTSSRARKHVEREKKGAEVAGKGEVTVVLNKDEGQRKDFY